MRNSHSHLNTQPRGALNPGTLGLGGTESSVSSPLYRLERKGCPRPHTTTYARAHRKSRSICVLCPAMAQKELVTCHGPSASRLESPRASCHLPPHLCDFARLETVPTHRRGDVIFLIFPVKESRLREAGGPLQGHSCS